MSLILKNCLKQSYTTYELRLIKRFVEQLPKDRRASFAQELLCRANLFGCSNVSALQEALKHLNGAEEK